MTSNTYRYGVYSDLTSAELFFFVAVEETCARVGIDDVEAVVLILAGWPVLPTRQKFGGATKGTSVASVMARSVFRYQLNRKVLPTVTLQSIKSFRIILTRKLSVFIGRAIPGVGWALLAHDVFGIVHGTVSRYNSLVKPEDKVF